MSPTLVRYSAALLLVIALSACGSNAPSTPTPQPNPTVRPSISIASIAVAAEAQASGYAYRVTVNLKESAGAAATISAVELTFMSGATVLTSSHYDKPISDNSNVVPASGSIATKELMTVDADRSHSAATTVRAQVTFTDGSSFVGTATGTAEVPAPSGRPGPELFTLTGVIMDAATRAGIGGARVEALNGANAGKSTTTNASGAYVFGGLVAETFRMRASAAGYDVGEQNVTVPENPRADFELRRPVATPCNYTVARNTSSTVSWEGGQFSATITRTSGTCSWQASTADAWITFPRGASGSDSGTLTYAIAPNGLNTRSGTIVVAWSGGSGQVGVTQGPHPDFECFVAISKGPQDFDNVPSGGGTLTVLPSVFAIPAGWPCTASVSSGVPWMSGGGTISGPSTMTFTVAANPSPGTPRTGTISVATGGKTASVLVTQR